MNEEVPIVFTSFIILERIYCTMGAINNACFIPQALNFVKSDRARCQWHVLRTLDFIYACEPEAFANHIRPIVHFF